MMNSMKLSKNKTVNVRQEEWTLNKFIVATNRSILDRTKEWIKKNIKIELIFECFNSANLCNVKYIILPLSKNFLRAIFNVLKGSWLDVYVV